MNADLPSWGAGDPNGALPWADATVVDSERLVLGCCLMPLAGDDQHGLIREVMQALPEEAWLDRRDWLIVRALCVLTGVGKIVDDETVAHYLRGGVEAGYIEGLAYHWADSALLLPGRLERLRAAWEIRRGKAEAGRG